MPIWGIWKYEYSDVTQKAKRWEYMLLEIRDLNTHYGPSHVLQGISMDIAKGELVALLGRNGMGKSTTLKSIMGMVKLTSGSVKFEGRR